MRPMDVHELVTFALDMGWDPEERGPPFRVPWDEDLGPDLSGFSLCEAA